MNLHCPFKSQPFFHSSGPMYTRATVMGVFFTFGNSGGIISSWTYPSTDSPRYIKGHAITLSFAVRMLCKLLSANLHGTIHSQCLAMIMSAALMYYNHTENKRRDRIYGTPAQDGSDCSPDKVSDPSLLRAWNMESKSETEMILLGDRHPAFRY